MVVVAPTVTVVVDGATCTLPAAADCPPPESSAAHHDGAGADHQRHEHADDHVDGAAVALSVAPHDVSVPAAGVEA
ncbi:MAG: hypothetical protein U0W40_18155 [Acidimicrobiia bacterium]